MAEHIELTVQVSAYKPLEDRPAGEPHLDEPLPTPQWDAQTNDQRKAVLYLVRDGLQDLFTRVEQWVPISFTAETGSRLDVMFQLDCADIDAAVMAQQLSFEHEEEKMLRELAKMQEKLGD